MQIDVLGELDVFGVDAERLIAALKIRTVYLDAAVETPRTEQRLVENLGTVGRGQNDDALAGIKAVDLGQQLIERLLTLVVAAEATKSEPEMEKNGTFASPATALASSVLPVPGEPTSSAPFGSFAPMAAYFCG